MNDDCTTTGPTDASGPTGNAAPISSLLPAFGFTADRMEADANVAAWREAVATLFDVDELAADEPGPFRADITSYAMGPVLIGLSRASGQRFRRTGVRTAAGADRDSGRSSSHDLGQSFGSPVVVVDGGGGGGPAVGRARLSIPDLE